jgi:hypothetical protein
MSGSLVELGNWMRSLTGGRCASREDAVTEMLGEVLRLA